MEPPAPPIPENRIEEMKEEENKSDKLEEKGNVSPNKEITEHQMNAAKEPKQRTIKGTQKKITLSEFILSLEDLIKVHSEGFEYLLDTPVVDDSVHIYIYIYIYIGKSN